jgi:hypothetical protein
VSVDRPEHDCLVLTCREKFKKGHPISVISKKQMKALAVLLSVVSTFAAEVSFVRVPDGGIQPRAAIDRVGTLHLLYYRGEAAGGDLFYVRRENGQEAFSRPIRVNSQPRRAIAAGTIRGAQMALGREGMVHVAWNGTVPEGKTYLDAPMLYTRLKPDRTGFEPERDVIQFARGLDGGGSIAATQDGKVFVFWHAPQPGNTKGEPGRALYVARSRDDGQSFEREVLATAEPTGACGCCGMNAFADSRGDLFAIFRGASESGNRDEILLASRDSGSSFEIAYRHGWRVPACPMSSAHLAESADSIVMAAETHERVFYVRLDPKSGAVSSPVSPEVKAKHPVVAANRGGELLFAWIEGTSWGKGGTVAWRMYDREGAPLTETGRRSGVPAWSFASAVAQPGGEFTILY